ncbi:uncharacterized protein LOC127003841 isoform X5 [Eriocheir sinensis]|uniref:uncharacterized protein LOC127003841 isoform X4 n=1 Tax=Eriocheir sinensis TaxID=95602 RepID=UPI0021C76029|nr:uncharacterized protein LOC127003841 isoform X4 [Eriocheir sinensis]XP_050726877.1 uncharacterized protein LOC127003841 isoform X5 [Eriocheir sinensis]
MASRPDFFLGCLVVGCYLVAAVQGGTLTCRQEGRFPHPEDCGSYVDCIRTADGKFRVREGFCHGFAFSGKERRCVDLADKPDCVPKATRVSFPLSAFNFLCAEDEMRTDCLNCNLAFTCVTGTAVVDICDSDSLCEVSGDFGGSVCLPIPSTTTKCKCDKTGLFQDPHNATYFSYCDINTQPYSLETFMCPEGLTFNSLTQKCEDSIPPTPPETPLCEDRTGSFVNPNDCRYYYTCIPGGIVRTSNCSEGQYYDAVNGKCEKKCTLAPPNASLEPCKALGHLPHPSKDCTKHLVCKKIGEDPEVKDCPQDIYYNETARACKDTKPSADCKANGGFDYYSCPGHDDVACGGNVKVKRRSDTADGGNDPGDGGSDPLDGGSDPGDGGSNPGDGFSDPGDGSSNPGDGFSDPGDGGSNPGDGFSDPGDGGSNPGDGFSDPGDGGSNPGDGFSDPGDGSSNSGDGFSDPGDGGS